VDSQSNKLAFNDGWQYAPAPESTDHIQIDDKYDLFIGGEFVAPEEGRYFETINPATEATLSSVAMAGDADIDRAVKAARKAYNGPWSKMKASVSKKANCCLSFIHHNWSTPKKNTSRPNGGVMIYW